MSSSGYAQTEFWLQALGVGTFAAFLFISMIAWRNTQRPWIGGRKYLILLFVLGITLLIIGAAMLVALRAGSTN